jgi:hypothetical protein
MKKIAVFTLALFFTISLYSQDVSEVFQTEKVTWYGFDYSNAFFIGSEGFTNPQDVKERIIHSWNSLIENEYEKFNVGKYFYKSKVDFSLDNVTERNKTVDINIQFVDDNSKMFHLNMDTIQDIINDYKFGDEEEGLGLVFIVESYSKPTVTASYYVTFFDIKSKKVLLTERMTNKAGGFGVRNYWASTYYNIMKTIYKKKYKSWERLHNPK